LGKLLASTTSSISQDSLPLILLFWPSEAAGYTGWLFCDTGDTLSFTFVSKPICPCFSSVEVGPEEAKETFWRRNVCVDINNKKEVE
jgi:hypothetical protein